MTNLNAQNVVMLQSINATLSTTLSQSMFRLLVWFVIFATNIWELDKPTECITIETMELNQWKIDLKTCCWLLLICNLVSATAEGNMYKSDDGSWQCNLCDYNSKYTTRVKDHIEAKHFITSGYECSVCQKYCSTKNALKCHMSKYHKKE